MVSALQRIRVSSDYFVIKRRGQTAPHGGARQSITAKLIRKLIGNFRIPIYQTRASWCNAAKGWARTGFARFATYRL